MSALDEVENVLADQLMSNWRLAGYDKARDKLNHPESLTALLQPVGLFHLPSDVLIGQIRSLDVNRNGDFAIVDRVSRDAYLLRADGKSFARLDPTLCHPGYNFSPLAARFVRNGRILVTSNTSPAGFFFDADGACLESIDLHTILPAAVETNSRGVTVFATTRSDYEVYTVDEDGRKRLLFTSDSYGRINGVYRTADHLAQVGDDGVALALMHSPLLWLISTATGEAKQIGRQPRYYREVTRDVSPSHTDIRDIMNDLRLVFDGKSRTVGVHAVTDSILMVMHRNSAPDFETSDVALGIQLITADGDVINDQPILMKGFQAGFVGAGFGFVFRRGTAYESDDPDSNLPIIVYRFNHNGT